jgi:3-dehydroshikimate dehydratase
MKLFLCTITFRHHLVSIDEIAAWARDNGFQGIELWGVHARGLAARPDRDGDWLAGFGLSVPMLSDYLPMDVEPAMQRRQMLELCGLAQKWRARKIRTFAGSRASGDTPPEERGRIVHRLREICAIAADHSISLLAETHPNTLADCGVSTLRLIEEVGHPAFRINFDTLHVWEGGDDAAVLHRLMRPYIHHYHLKNVRSRADLRLFDPANVYAPAGRREGMVPLFDGAFDYAAFLGEVLDDPAAEASLEWFGPDCLNVLRGDRGRIRRMAERRRAQPLLASG